MPIANCPLFTNSPLQTALCQLPTVTLKSKLIIIILTIISLQQTSLAQKGTYSIEKAFFSSDLYDEFSPVFYKNGIVFCSNRTTGLTDYSTSQDKGLFKMYFIDTTGKRSWQNAVLFSKALTSRLNDGPATFYSGQDTIIYSRNLDISGNLRDISSQRNKLGLFSAVLTNGKWTNIKELRINIEWFNISMPCLSPDGKILYFASDKPDGYGGFDIYYSLLKNGSWSDPVNLGPLINTKGNESYPFINKAGELFFSSDGRKGLGGMDIYVTKQRGSAWYTPERLDEPVNSEFDDFGIVINPLKEEGYFSSNRGKTIDIYYFKSDMFHFWFSEPQKENQYCLSIEDTGSIIVDTLRFKYVWSTSNGFKIDGTNFKYCFPGQGIYKINKDIIDRRTGKLFFRKLTYDIEIFEIDQPFITSPDNAVVGETIKLDGLKSFCQGYEINSYFWDFGDGTRTTGDSVSHKFIKSGEFDIRMGLNLKSRIIGGISKRVVSKKIRIFQTGQERADYLSGNPQNKPVISDISRIGNIKILGRYSAEEDFRKEAVFQVVLKTSKTRMDRNDVFFGKVPLKYYVKEYFDSESGSYCYFVDQQMSLMAALPAYNELLASGYRDAIVKISVLKEPAEIELFNIMKKYGVLTDTYFDTTNKLTTSAFIMLDQIAMLMSKYPTIKLETGVHTDNQGFPATNLSLSQFWSQIIVNYLVSRGISGNRLVPKGYGDMSPVASNIYASGRKLNRRVDFILLK